jgi:predicted ATPase
MLTKLEIKNFKRFEDVTIELGSPVVFIGPNNSGKTTALQALSLWGMARDISVINRRDFAEAVVPHAGMLWRDLEFSSMLIRVEGVSAGQVWHCGFEFRYANQESFGCAPSTRVPLEALDVRLAFLPPMSGLADREFFKQPGEISFLIGQGRTAEVLRNLCLQVSQQSNGKWGHLAATMERLFGVRIEEPVLVKQRSEIVMSYRERSGVELDLSSAGRGVHQTLLLLAYMAVNPGAVLLLDEPDAHLEILRQRQIYRVLCEAAEEQGSQIIAATHSEVILNEAADKDVVIAFLGKPHRIDDRGAQVLKSLKEIGFEQYYQAEDRGWVLYLEGSTDLAILQTFAATLKHLAQEVLASPFAHYVGTHPQEARKHFGGLAAAKPDLVGMLICDRLERPLQRTPQLDERMWTRRKIENYLCQPETLLAFAESLADGSRADMEASIADLVPPVALRDRNDAWWKTVKASDEFLDRLFEDFFKRAGTPNAMRKTNYHRLASYVAIDDIDPEVTQMLDAILEQSKKAHRAP